MKKLLFILLGTLTLQFSQAQAPNDNIGSGNCLDFDGNDYVGSIGNLGDYSFIQNTGVFTLESWMRLSSLADKEYMLIANTPTGVENGFFFEPNVVGGRVRLRINILNGAGSVILSDSPFDVITDTDWHHVACVGDGTNITFFVDGIAYAGSGTMGVFATGNSSRQLQIGDSYSVVFGPVFYFEGQADEVRIWNTVRTQAQIRNNMCKPLQGNEAGLVGYWNMNEGAGGTITDLTPNGNDGTLQ